MLGIETALDWFFYDVINPMLHIIGLGLELIIVKPMDILQIPLEIQVIVVAGLTVGLSFAIGKILKKKEKDAEFQAEFSVGQSLRKHISALSDVEIQNVLYAASDHRLDADYNDYLAQHFVRHCAMHVIPVSFSLLWLHSIVLGDKGAELNVNGLFLLFYIGFYVLLFLIKQGSVRKSISEEQHSSNVTFSEPKKLHSK